MKELNPIQNGILYVGAVLVVIGAAIHLFYPVPSSIIYMVGVLCFVPMQMLARYEGSDFVILRLRRQQLFGGIALLLSSAAMTMQTFQFGPSWARGNEWVLCLAIASVLELYTTLRLAHELEKNR